MSGQELTSPIVESGGAAAPDAPADRFLRRALRSRLFLTGAVISVFFAMFASVGLVLLAVPSLHHLYLDENLTNALAQPGSHGVLGTDELGRSMVFRLIVGCAVSLGISVKTAETHRANIMRKLELHSVSELVRYAVKNQIIEA